MKPRIFWICLLIGVGVVVYYYLFTSPASNYRVATIEKTDKGYLVVVKGDRVLLSHDLFSALSRKTYIDSNIYILPRSTGAIKADELSIRRGYKRIGEISIYENRMKIELYSDNVDDQRLDPETWNGEYELTWRNK